MVALIIIIIITIIAVIIYPQKHGTKHTFNSNKLRRKAFVKKRQQCSENKR